MAGADVPSGEDNSPADADAAETANAATVHRIVRARDMAHLRVLDDLAARDTNGAEIFRAAAWRSGSGVTIGTWQCR